MAYANYEPCQICNEPAKYWCTKCGWTMCGDCVSIVYDGEQDCSTGLWPAVCKHCIEELKEKPNPRQKIKQIKINPELNKW